MTVFTSKNQGCVKSRPYNLIFIAALCTFAVIVFAQDKVHRSFSWTLEEKNDPILQVKNQSDQTIRVEIRLLLTDESFRYPEDLEVPSGESRFLRIREVLDRLSRRYEQVGAASSGTLQTQFVGDPEEVQITMVNLHPKLGITSEKSGGQSPPVIRSLDPTSGSPSGGTRVTITGENFGQSTIVKFGGISAMRNLQSSDELVAIAPPHSPAVVDVEVSNGKSGSGLRRAFTYAADNPSITRVEPDVGPVSGGDTISILGHNFESGAKVNWAGRFVLARFVNPQELTLVVPPGRRGPVDIEVVNPDGRHFVLENAFVYGGAPRVTSIRPTSGSAHGGYIVTVYGENFDPGCTVLFNGNYAETTFINPNTLAAFVPSSDENGPVDVSVSTEYGEIGTLRDAFLYNEPPIITSVTAVPNPIVRNTTTTITVEADDPEAGPLEYEYRIAQGTGRITGQGRTAVFNSPNVIGIAVIQVTVYDQHRAKAQQNLEIHVE
jgi:IPT/TIG domain